MVPSITRLDQMAIDPCGFGIDHGLLVRGLTTSCSTLLYIIWEIQNPASNCKPSNKGLIAGINPCPFASEVSCGLNQSLSQSEESRTNRLRIAPKLPTEILTVSRAFRRNPDVVAAVLHRADGKCERCGKSAPFIRASDGTPYLEVHHKKMLAEGGEDTVENAMAVCPNCHRELHFGVCESSSHC